MEFITLLVVGLSAGLLVSHFAGGSGYGKPRDIAIGIVGAWLSYSLFTAMGIGAPFGGIAGTLLVAAVGAVVLVLTLRVIRHARRIRDLWTRGPSPSSPWR